jgi:adenine-specific DNA-methyltransferase
MVLNYIGSKKTLAQRLVGEIVKNWPDLKTWDLCDAFAGTGAISVAIAEHVNSITVNDWEPFTQHLLNAQFNPPKNPLALVDNLNKAEPTTGAITLTYSEAAGRLFFTTLNAQRIDGIREALRDQIYTEEERSYLIGSLVSSADSIANVASVYGAFLKDFKNSAQNLLNLKIIVPAPKKAVVLKMDAQLLCVDPAHVKSNTLLYLDPPYNQRQYGANYFPLNAIADIYADSLNVTGITGLPQDGYRKSGFCSKKTAHQDLTDIVKNTPANRIALSYNNEGILSHDAIVDIFVSNNWNYKKAQIPYKRFASQKDLEPDTLEYLFLAEKIQ